MDLTSNGGVIKTILSSGYDERGYPANGDIVRVHYEGWLKRDGKIIDSSRDRGEPYEFILGEQNVIKGWNVGVATMLTGELAQLECREEYAYGAKGNPPMVPPRATLIYELELLQWEKSHNVSASKSSKSGKSLASSDGSSSLKSSVSWPDTASSHSGETFLADKSVTALSLLAAIEAAVYHHNHGEELELPFVVCDRVPVEIYNEVLDMDDSGGLKLDYDQQTGCVTILEIQGPAHGAAVGAVNDLVRDALGNTVGSTADGSLNAFGGNRRPDSSWFRRRGGGNSSDDDDERQGTNRPHLDRRIRIAAALLLEVAVAQRLPAADERCRMLLRRTPVREILLIKVNLARPQPNQQRRFTRLLARVYRHLGPNNANDANPVAAVDFTQDGRPNQPAFIDLSLDSIFNVTPQRNNIPHQLGHLNGVLRVDLDYIRDRIMEVL